MKYCKMYILIMLLIQTMGISAQSIISGRIIDKNSAPITGVSVLAISRIDSAYITGTTSDQDGRFELSNSKPGNYILSLSMVGYKKVNIPQQIGQGNHIGMGNIVLEEDAYMLSAVTVMGKQAPFKIEPGKITINLSSALLSTDGNILEVLRKLPGVIVQNDGTIILNGKAGTSILLDDRATYLSRENLINYLRSIPSKSIDNIELISQPSSKHDATGNSGVINIQKKKIAEQGINLTVSSSVERGEYNRWSESLSLAAHFNKLNIYTDYSVYWGVDFENVFALRTYLNENPPMQLEMDASRKKKYNAQYVRTGIDYNLSEKTTIGTYFSSYWIDRKKEEVSSSAFFTNKTQNDSILITQSVMDYNSRNITGGIGISHKWAKRGEWDTSFDYQLFDQGDNQILKSTYKTNLNPLNKDTLSGKTNGNIKIYSGQSNLRYDLSNKMKMAGGLKTVFVNINSDALYKNLTDGYWIQDNHLSSGFGYKENINAAYLQLKSMWSSRLSSEIGLRLENTNIESRYGSNENDSAFHQNYTHIFPSVMGQYRASDKHYFSIVYGRRIVRPNYKDMNPFIEVRDRFLHDKGNPGLKPELIDNIEFSWLFKKQFIFATFYSYRKNPITKSYLAEDNTTLVMPLNLSENHSAGLRIGLNNLKAFDWWTIHINSSLTYKQFHWMVAKELRKNELISPMVHFNNQLSLPLGWKMEATGYYNGYMAEGQAKIHPVWSVSIGIRKNLLNDKLGLYLYANDIFHSSQPYIELQSNSMSGRYKAPYDSRMAGITLSYRFSRGKESKKPQGGNKIEESKRIIF